MKLENAKESVSAASIALIFWCACVALFIPPLNKHLPESTILLVLLGLAIASSLIIHLIFIGIAARQLERSVCLWVLLALVTMPLGPIIGIVVYEWAAKHHSGRAPHGAA